MIQGLVSTIVVNWNGKDFVLDCLASLAAQTYQPHEIIVVDNASTDGSFEKLVERFGSSLKLLRNPKNLGFAEGVNVGIRVSRGEFIALLNSDAAAKENWIEELVRGIRGSESIAMAASKIYLTGREGILDNTGEVISRDGLGKGRGRLEKDWGQYDTPGEVLCPSGAAAFYRRKMLEEAGGFDKHFFLYAEDMDIGLRGRLLGYRSIYIPTAVVFHKFSSSSEAASSLKAYYVERNRLWIVLKCFPSRHLLLSPYYTLLRYFCHFYGLLSRQGPAAQYVKQFSFLRLLLILAKVYLSTIWFFPYLVIQRIKLQKKSKLTPREFEHCLKSFGVGPREAALDEIV